MDDLYDNLENYNEENTIAELQTENKELKSKLEEYAVTLTSLQKEFDKLSSEYKQLELNYSSLLKTAKAEIERKTQIITNLNLEKDRMVLKSFQNKNGGGLYKSRDSDYSMVHQNSKKDKCEKSNNDEKLKWFEGRKSSSFSSVERKEQNEPPSRDTTSSPHPDLRSKLLNVAHGSQHDSSAEKNSDAKENIMQQKTESDVAKARDSIRNRRKSMPVISTEMEQISDDDDLASAASSKTIQQMNIKHKVSVKQKHVDQNLHERPRSRTSDSSSLEEKKPGQHESIPDSLLQRSSRYDGHTTDKYRARHKSSHRYKRRSPDKYPSGPREYYDPYHRGDHNRHRAKGRILESPPRDKFYHRSSRDLHRINYERSYPYEHEKYLPQSQERYPIKRRIEHSYDELENKRMKMGNSRELEENRRMELDNKRSKMESHSRYLERDQRMRSEKDERNPLDKKFITDPLDIQFSSCESPDYDFLEVSNQQVKEIKFTATTKLDDPRTSSKRYVLKKNDGQVVLSTAIGRNVDIVPVRKIAWGLDTVSMPEALVKRPQEKQSARDEYMETENQANVPIESRDNDDLNDLDDINTQNYPQQVNKLKVPSNDRIEPPVQTTKFDDSKDIEKSLKNINSFKIPKLIKSVDDKQSTEDSKEVTLSVKPDHDNTDSIMSKKNSDMTTNDIVNKQHTKQAEAEVKMEPECHKQDSLDRKNQLLCLNTNRKYEQKYSTAKEVVECDLEMSDDNCDDNEQTEHVTKEPVLRTELETKTIDMHERNNTNTEKQSIDATEKVTLEPCKEKRNKNDNVTKEPVLRTELETKTIDMHERNNTNTEKQSIDATEKVTLEPCKEKRTKNDTKKSKSKKKSKHKETKEAIKSVDLARLKPRQDNPDKKEDKKKETKSIQIKTKFSELFDDSCSLISPEDLGLAAVLAPTTRLPDTCVPFFEDAVDATDLNTIKSDAIKDSGEPEESNLESKRHSDVTMTKIDIDETINQEDSLEKLRNDTSNNVQTELTDEVIKSIYQNLEPSVPEQEDNVVKTVIISSGIQPPVLLEDEKQFPSKPEPQLKTIQDVDLKALATSTPHKIWQPDIIMADMETKQPDSGCNSSNSQIASVDNSAKMDKSNSNTMDSQNEANVPDVRIFVKRRRKVVKK